MDWPINGLASSSEGRCRALGLFGVEAQFSWVDLEGTTPCVVVFACKTDTKWVTTLAGRLGFTVDRALIYVKGGVVWADSDYTV